MNNITAAGRPPVSVIGLGAMGSALARAFMAAGHPTTVWNRTPEKAGPLVEAGAQLAETVTEAVNSAKLVVTCLIDFEHTREVLLQASPQLPGRDLVTLNSGAPPGARATASWAVEHGARFLAGAVKDSTSAVGGRETLLYYGGDRDLFDEHRATLQSLGGDTVYLGEAPDLAALYEMAVSSMLLPTLMGFYQGAAALQNRGLTAASMVPYAERWLDLIKRNLAPAADQIDRRDYSDATATVDLFLSVSQAEQEFASEAGVDVSWKQPAWDMVRRASELGYGRQEITAVIEVLKE